MIIIDKFACDVSVLDYYYILAIVFLGVSPLLSAT